VSAREEILTRARIALAGSDPDPLVAVEPPAQTPPAKELLAGRFAERVRGYRATVTLVAERGLPEAVAAVLHRHAASYVVAPSGLHADALPDGIVRVPGDLAGSPAELDAVDGVVTACALAIAETGTIVLDGGEDQGPRALTLLPDLHVCIVRSEQIVAGVGEAIRALNPRGRSPVAPLTFISGPSATSDIELDRVEGVHGPRRLEVILVHAFTTE
jgi:L-lactate dehydrogenase complex protein LldG